MYLLSEYTISLCEMTSYGSTSLLSVSLHYCSNTWWKLSRKITGKMLRKVIRMRIGVIMVVDSMISLVYVEYSVSNLYHILSYQCSKVKFFTSSVLIVFIFYLFSYFRRSEFFFFSGWFGQALAHTHKNSTCSTTTG